ncbi:hypothetical protein HZB88_02805 [archaeon]|nr:hypothetical protein [archaeon]
MRIKDIKAKIIKNCKGEDTIEIFVNKKYSASAPSGTSKGAYEVADYAHGLAYAVNFVNNLEDIKKFNFNEARDLRIFEDMIPLVGGNPVVALQCAVLRAMSNNNVWEFLNPYVHKMPVPLGNCIGGGSHGNGTDMQEFLLVPNGESFKENAFVNNNVYKKIKNLFGAERTTMEGAVSPKQADIAVLKRLTRFLADESNTLGIEVGLGVDAAASNFWNIKSRRYIYRKLKKRLNKQQQIAFMNRIAGEFGLKYIEDPLREDDFNGFSKIKCRLVCGDDLIATNIQRLKTAIKNKSINAVIIKPNQIGSLLKAKEAVDYAKANNIVPVMSHRSGETMDDIISDLAVAWDCPYIKCGIFGKEREAKIKRLIRIEESI